MKKYVLLMGCLLLVVYSATGLAQSYCDNGPYSAQYIWVESVASGGVVNLSGPHPDYQGDQDHLYESYVDYTDLTFNWQSGLNEVDLVPGALPALAGLNMHWQMWVDVNVDGVFAANERMVAVNGVGPINRQFDLSDLQLSEDLTTRARISMAYMENAPSCGVIGYGEVEDYSVTIQAPTVPTWRVPEDYATIQQAVNAASAGDRILVNDGAYQGSVIVDKPLLIESVNGYLSTSVSAPYEGYSFLVTAPAVTIKGFELSAQTLRRVASIFFTDTADDGQVIDNRCHTGQSWGTNNFNVYIDGAERVTVTGLDCHTQPGSYTPAAIWAIDTSDSQFINNNISGQAYFGIYVADSMQTQVLGNTLSGNFRAGLGIDTSDRIIVQDNVCDNNQFQTYPIPINFFHSFHNGNGLSAYQSYELSFVNNACSNNLNHGIHVDSTVDVTIAGNAVEVNGADGIHLSASDSLHISNNSGSNNSQAGLLMDQVSNSLVEFNQLTANGRMAMLVDSSDSIITRNLFSYTGNVVDCQFELDGAADLQIYLNEFNLNGSGQLCSTSVAANLWLSPSPVGYLYAGEAMSSLLGNYYSDADHTDVDANGISDAVYVLPGNEGVDAFSLSVPLSSYDFQ